MSEFINTDVQAEPERTSKILAGTLAALTIVGGYLALSQIQGESGADLQAIQTGQEIDIAPTDGNVVSGQLDCSLRTGDCYDDGRQVDSRLEVTGGDADSDYVQLLFAGEPLKTWIEGEGLVGAGGASCFSARGIEFGAQQVSALSMPDIVQFNTACVTDTNNEPSLRVDTREKGAGGNWMFSDGSRDSRLGLGPGKPEYRVTFVPAASDTFGHVESASVADNLARGGDDTGEQNDTLHVDESDSEPSEGVLINGDPWCSVTVNGFLDPIGVQPACTADNGLSVELEASVSGASFDPENWWIHMDGHVQREDPACSGENVQFERNGSVTVDVNTLCPDRAGFALNGLNGSLVFDQLDQ